MKKHTTARTTVLASEHIRRDHDRLLRWLRKWRQERFLYTYDWETDNVSSIGLADADSLAAEIQKALDGKWPPSRKRPNKKPLPKSSRC